jgi:CheY-like chemotaxis protein
MEWYNHITNIITPQSGNYRQYYANSVPLSLGMKMLDSKQFQLIIRDVLNHLSDVAYLENNNLINPLLSEEEARQSNHVSLLQTKIRESINVLRPPENTPPEAAEWRCFRILTLHFLSGRELYRVEDELGLSQRQVYRELKKGLDALISILWKQQQALQMGMEQRKELQNEILDSYDLNILQKELKSWEITYDLSNLYQIIEQAYHLCEYFLNSDLCSRIHYENVDQNLNVRVDNILTKQGLYKILTIVENRIQDSEVWMRTRKLNDHFIELSITIKHDHPLNLNNWQIAQLFFTIQGLNHFLKEQVDVTYISINLPLKNQDECLVIDDVVSVRTLIERMLGPYGIQVFGADNPKEALNLAQLIKPNFILLDILMPKMDGWQMIKMLKSNPETSNIPVFICSVLNEPELSRSFGAAGFIRKPINRLDLINTLQQASLIDLNL